MSIKHGKIFMKKIELKDKKVNNMTKETQIEKLRDITPFNDWINDVEIPQTNEWKTKIPIIKL